MKITKSKLRSIVCNLMAELGLLDRPATPDEIVKIVQAVLAEAEGREAEPLAPKPLAPKLVVPEDPDDQSVKEALFIIYRHRLLREQLDEIPGCECFSDYDLNRPPDRPFLRIYARFSHQDEIREVLA